MSNHPWLTFTLAVAGTSALIAWVMSRQRGERKAQMPWGAIVMCALLGLLLTLGNKRAERRYARLMEAPRRAVRDLRPGMALVTGRVVPVKRMMSPLLQQECVYCSYWIDELRSSGRHTTSWEFLYGSDDFVWFAVDDGTGRVMVWPDHAERTLKTRGSIAGDLGDPSFPLGEFMNRAGIDSGKIRGTGRRLSIGEGFVQPGDTVTLVGTVRAAAPSDEAAGKAGAPWVIEGTAAARILLTDRDPAEYASTLAWDFLPFYWIGGVFVGIGLAGVLGRL